MVSQSLEERSERLLCAVFGFRGEDGPVQLVYAYKRGTFYPSSRGRGGGATTRSSSASRPRWRRSSPRAGAGALVPGLGLARPGPRREPRRAPASFPRRAARALKRQRNNWNMLAGK